MSTVDLVQRNDGKYIIPNWEIHLHKVIPMPKDWYNGVNYIYNVKRKCPCTVCQLPRFSIEYRGWTYYIVMHDFRVQDKAGQTLGYVGFKSFRLQDFRQTVANKVKELLAVDRN